MLAPVALARVLYADADVVFLDDVMSALDAHTGAAVWRQVVLCLIH
jgi:ABC-type multidrug transport system fused ATPase/permease subunit